MANEGNMNTISNSDVEQSKREAKAGADKITKDPEMNALFWEYRNAHARNQDENVKDEDIKHRINEDRQRAGKEQRYVNGEDRLWRQGLERLGLDKNGAPPHEMLNFAAGSPERSSRETSRSSEGQKRTQARIEQENQLPQSGSGPTAAELDARRFIPAPMPGKGQLVVIPSSSDDRGNNAEATGPLGQVLRLVMSLLGIDTETQKTTIAASKPLKQKGTPSIPGEPLTLGGMPIVAQSPGASVTKTNTLSV